LSDSSHGLLIEPGTETADDADVGRAAVAIHHDLEIDFALDATSARLFGVVRPDFTNEPGRLNPAPWAERPPAGAAAGPFS
jgi:hypothetical protein